MQPAAEVHRSTEPTAAFGIIGKTLERLKLGRKVAAGFGHFGTPSSALILAFLISCFAV
ncbi:hypothetical protein [Sphingomonas immobilis]|uniref:Uncharacterized protein n=1 Tax=Sphingomonas immobilis TaxID=3063997 RepID=A0ABT8ZW21_9SPHN|nr:hypothetical protein [Sphingomonas sp. CA1-15]MDO7841766.1 hypothetical protein [Sphingomonas sp. CA1-15]